MGRKLEGQLGFEEESFKRVTSDNRKPEEQYFFDGDGNLIEAQTPAQQKALLEDYKNRQIRNWEEAKRQILEQHPDFDKPKNQNRTLFYRVYGHEKPGGLLEGVGQ